MSRPRKPVTALENSGSFEINPARAENRAPVTPGAPLGDPPDELPDDVKAAWREIVANAAPGLLVTYDFLAVRSAARLLARENAGTILMAERRLLHDLLREFGGTPKGRNYVHVPPVKKHNQFADL